MAVASPQMLIADLRHWLARMESHGRASAAVLPFGFAEVDAHVPGGGLQLGHLHEVIEGGARRMRREFAARDKPLVTAMMQGQRRILASVDEAAARVGLSIGSKGDPTVPIDRG